MKCVSHIQAIRCFTIFYEYKKCTILSYFSVQLHFHSLNIINHQSRGSAIHQEKPRKHRIGKKSDADKLFHRLNKQSVVALQLNKN